MDDGIAAANAEGFFGDAQDWGRLAAFVFSFVDAAAKVTDFGLGDVEFFGDDFDGQVVFDIRSDDHVDEVVGRQ